MKINITTSTVLIVIAFTIGLLVSGGKKIIYEPDNRLQNEVNELRLRLVLDSIENDNRVKVIDSIQWVNDSMQRVVILTDSDKRYFYLKYLNLKKELNTGAEIEPSEVFINCDTLLNLQQQQISKLESINTNSEIIISELEGICNNQAKNIQLLQEKLTILTREYNQNITEQRQIEAKNKRLKRQRNISGMVAITLIGGFFVFN